MEKPLIVQGDLTLLLEVSSPGFEKARSLIIPFAELEKSPEHMHTYRITPLSLWNAASAGITSEYIFNTLNNWYRYSIQKNVFQTIDDIINRFGKLILSESNEPSRYCLQVKDNFIYQDILSRKNLAPFLIPGQGCFYLSIFDRGTIKQELIRIGYPIQDLLPMEEGEKLTFSMLKTTRSGYPFTIREYQQEAADAFLGSRLPGTGFGTLVLPCGAGKTILAMRIIEILQTSTLVITTNVAALHQWLDELLDKTSLTEKDIGEYSGDIKEIRPVTAATYQILTYRNRKNGDFPHFHIFRQRKWGLIVYDEVHLLPAPVFRITAEIQSIRRLGLTATLIREDGKEDEVFALVGPKRYDVPWKELEEKGWIAEANCTEIRVPLPEEKKIPYASADKRRKFRIASENPWKISIVKQLIENHREDSILVIGQYIDQLVKIAGIIKAPLITGKTPNQDRDLLYRKFRAGEEKVLVVSKVANFAIDLPDASVAIQVSGTFGSRQEEAQRLGRILRPKERNANFYSLVSHFTTEENFASNRQKFLTEQGYKYTIELWDEKEFLISESNS